MIHKWTIEQMNERIGTCGYQEQNRERVARSARGYACEHDKCSDVAAAAAGADADADATVAFRHPSTHNNTQLLYCIVSTKLPRSRLRTL